MQVSVTRGTLTMVLCTMQHCSESQPKQPHRREQNSLICFEHNSHSATKSPRMVNLSLPLSNHSHGPSVHDWEQDFRFCQLISLSVWECDPCLSLEPNTHCIPGARTCGGLSCMWAETEWFAGRLKWHSHHTMQGLDQPTNMADGLNEFHLTVCSAPCFPVWGLCAQCFSAYMKKQRRKKRGFVIYCASESLVLKQSVCFWEWHARMGNE